MEARRESKSAIFKSFSARNLPSISCTHEGEENLLQANSASEIAKLGLEAELMDKDVSSSPYSTNASQYNNSDKNSTNSIVNEDDLSNRSIFLSSSPASTPKLNPYNSGFKKSIFSETSSTKLFIGANSDSTQVNDTNIPIT
jgi:hypothetical protein